MLDADELNKERLELYAVWGGLEANRSSNQRDRKAELQTFEGILDIEIARNDCVAAVAICRRARELRVESDRVIDYPFSVARRDLGFLQDAELVDVVEWAVRQEPNLVDPAAAAEASLRLRRTVYRSQQPEHEQAIDRLANFGHLWSWPGVYWADRARAARDWRLATVKLRTALATMMLPATQLLHEPFPSKGAMMWTLAYCSYALGDLDSAEQECRQAWAEQHPTEGWQWRLWAHFGPDHSERLNRLILGAEWGSHDPGYLNNLWRAAIRAGEWDRVVPSLQATIQSAKDTEVVVLAHEMLAVAQIRANYAEGFRKTIDELIGYATSGERVGQDLPFWVFAVKVLAGEHGEACSISEHPQSWIPTELSPLQLSLLQTHLGSGLTLSPPLNFEVESPSARTLGPEWSRLAWFFAHRLIFSDPPQALELIRTCNPVVRLDPYCLHVTAMLLTSKLSQRTGTIVDLLEAVGCWAALLTNSTSISAFVDSRVATYECAAPELTQREIIAMAVERLNESINAELSALGITSGQGSVLYDIENEAIRLLKMHGGIKVDELDEPLFIGPFLAHTMKLTESVRPWLRLPSASGSDELRRVFSPLARPAVYMRLGRYEEAEAALRIAADNPWAEVDTILSEFNDDQDAVWIDSQRHAMRIECELGRSRFFIAMVPVDLTSLKESWSEALDLSRSCGKVEETKRAIGEIAVGRSRALFEERSKTEREADPADKRPNTVRNAEAVETLEAAWDLVQDATIQGDLASMLNTLGVRCARREEFEPAIDYTLRALRLKPNARTSAENLEHIALAQLSRAMLADPETAGRKLADVVDKVRALDPNRLYPDIRRLVSNLRERGSIPFCNQANKAMKDGNWSEAVDMVILAVVIAPADKDARDVAEAVIVKLVADSKTEMANRVLNAMTDYARQSKGLPEQYL